MDRLPRQLSGSAPAVLPAVLRAVATLLAAALLAVATLLAAALLLAVPPRLAAGGMSEVGAAGARTVDKAPAGALPDSIERATCAPVGRMAELPPSLFETSGLALSGRHPGLLWTHNDSGHEPEVFGVDTAGTVVARVRVSGARNVDWEGMAQARCDGGSCLYVADVGDNLERRPEVVVYVIPEPALGDTVTTASRVIRFRYPDGPRDAEALAASSDGTLLVISKGRGGAPRTVYRVDGSGSPSPGRSRGGAVGARPRPGLVTAEALARLGGAPLYVTGASFTPDGRWLVLRGYWTLRAFAVGADGALRLDDGGEASSIASLGEPLGEAVAAREDGAVFLTSEGRGRLPAGLYRAWCRYPDGDPDREREASRPPP